MKREERKYKKSKEIRYPKFKLPKLLIPLTNMGKQPSNLFNSCSCSVNYKLKKIKLRNRFPKKTFQTVPVSFYNSEKNDR